MKTLIATFTLALSFTAACKKGDSKIGVAECDAYLDKMAACASKVGGTTGTQLTKMRDMMADAWKKDATGDSKDMMPKVCEGAINDMKKQVPQCDW